MLSFWIWRIRKAKDGPPRILWLPRLNRKLRVSYPVQHLRILNLVSSERFTPWQLILSTLTAVYALFNFDKIFGLDGDYSLLFY